MKKLWKGCFKVGINNKRFLIHDPEHLNLIPEVYVVQISMDYWCQSLLQNQSKEHIFPVKFNKNLTSLLITLKFKHPPGCSCLAGTCWKILHFN